MRLGLAEILYGMNSLTKRQEKIDFLRKHDNIMLRNVLQYIFDPRIVWLVPKNVKYNPSPEIGLENKMYMEFKKLYLFVGVKLGNDITPLHKEIDQNRREQLFIQFLERLDKADALIIANARNKKLPANFKGIDSQFISDTFPGLILLEETTTEDVK